MNLLGTIKTELKNIPHKELILKMGYQTEEKGLRTMNTFLKSKSMHDWLSSGHYDLKYTAEQFLEKLCSILNLAPSLLKDELVHYEKTVKEYGKFEEVYIFVNTHFKRESQPIFALAMMEYLRLILPDTAELIFKSDQEVFAIISDFVKIHFKENKGELKMWGKIDNYIYHHCDGKTHTFDKSGNLVKNASEVFENHATISL